MEFFSLEKPFSLFNRWLLVLAATVAVVLVGDALHGDVVDVWLLECLQVAVVALVGLFVTQHHLTQ